MAIDPTRSSIKVNSNELTNKKAPSLPKPLLEFMKIINMVDSRSNTRSSYKISIWTDKEGKIVGLDSPVESRVQKDGKMQELSVGDLASVGTPTEQIEKLLDSKPAIVIDRKAHKEGRTFVKTLNIIVSKQQEEDTLVKVLKDYHLCESAGVSPKEITEKIQKINLDIFNSKK